MEATILDPKKCYIFTNLFQNIKNFSDDVELRFENNRLYVQGFDSNHIALFEIQLLNTWFEEYTVKNDCTLGIKSSFLYNVLSCSDKTNTITLKYTEGSDSLNITLNHLTKTTSQKSYNLKLFNIDGELLAVPDTDYTADFEIKSIKFQKIVDELQLFSEIVGVYCDCDKLVFKSDGSFGDVKIEFGIDDLEGLAIEEDATIDVTYSLSYIEKMLSFCKLSKLVKMHIQKDLPMKLQYSLDSDDDENNYLRFYLAPRIEED